MMMAYPAVE